MGCKVAEPEPITDMLLIEAAANTFFLKGKDADRFVGLLKRQENKKWRLLRFWDIDKEVEGADVVAELRAAWMTASFTKVLRSGAVVPVASQNEQ